MTFEIITNKSGVKSIEFGRQENTQFFYQLAYKIESVLGIRYTKKTDNFNTLTWDYFVNGVLFHLQYHWDTGTRLTLHNALPTAEEDIALQQIIAKLELYLS